jgi:hypothetical protein
LWWEKTNTNEAFESPIVNASTMKECKDKGCGIIKIMYIRGKKGRRELETVNHDLAAWRGVLQLVNTTSELHGALDYLSEDISSN